MALVRSSLAFLMLPTHDLYPQAFRQLSHRFHGKGSGKMKTERRMKKLDEEAVSLWRWGVGWGSVFYAVVGYTGPSHLY